MWNDCCHGSPAHDFCGHDFCGHNQVSPAYHMGNEWACGDSKGNSSSFVLIVVLFILLIIVGKCYM